MTSEAIISIFLGIGLAASAGFRVFLPLLALSIAAHSEVWELNDSWQWIGSEAALIILVVATLVEVFGYYIPFIDNLLDSIAVPLAGIAGTLVMVSTVSDLSPEITWVLAIIAGGGTAVAISGASSATRLTSTVTTAGFTNPVVSAVETGTSIILSIFSIFLPVVAFILVLILVYIIFKVYKKIKPSKS